MAITIAQSFIDQFGTDVKHAYALASQLEPVVRKRTGVIGSTAKFHTMGKIAAYTKTRNADLTVLEPASAQVTVTLSDRYATDLFDDLDQFKSNISYRNEYLRNVSNALAEAQDAIVLTALGAATQAATTNVGAMSVARLLEIKKQMDNKRVPRNDRVMVLGATAMSNLLATTQASSLDYNSVKALVQGDLDTFVGFKFVQVPDDYLTLNTTPTPDTRLCFAFHKDALGVAVGQDVKTSVEWSPDKHAWWVKGVLSMGAGIIDNDGVVKFEVDI